MTVISTPILFDPNKLKPDFLFEELALASGLTRVAGIDEAGRGPICGPVVASAVILNPASFPAGLDDSKKLSATKRGKLFHEIIRTAKVGVGIASAREIDRINILQATFLAMTRASQNLEGGADYWLIDGDKVPPALAESACPIVKGDARSLSIAAASIVAKVTRDRIMEIAHMRWPQYGFARHAGYGTKAHCEALEKYGPCDIHRMTFAPVSAMSAA